MTVGNLSARIAALILATFVAVPAQADALLDQALGHGGAYSPGDWAYVSTTTVNAGGSTLIGDVWNKISTGARSQAPRRNIRITTYDPSKPKGERQVVLQDDSGPSDDAKRALNTRKGRNDTMIHTDEDERLPSYDDMKQLVKRDARRTGDSFATATYRFTVDPKDVRHIGSADFNIDSDTPLPPLTGIARVQKTGPFAPYVSTVTVYLPTGDRGRGNAAAKVRLLSMGFRFAPDPGRGVQLLRAFGFDTSLQALGLMTVDVSTLNRVGGYRYVNR